MRAALQEAGVILTCAVLIVLAFGLMVRARVMEFWDTVVRRGAAR